MNKNDYLRTLRACLEQRQIHKVDEIMVDYEEHFSHGQLAGQSEEHICLKLGRPEDVANSFETEKMIAQVQNSEAQFQWQLAVKIIGRMLVVAPFNFFVLLIPGVITFSMIMSGWAVAVAIAAVAFAFLIIAFIPFGFWANVALGSMSMGLLGFGLMVGLVMFLITKYILLAVINYLQWNLKFVFSK